jgi:hypothetical protein
MTVDYDVDKNDQCLGLQLPGAERRRACSSKAVYIYLLSVVRVVLA